MEKKTIYLDLKKQKRTLEQNEFTIEASSEEAKAFFTTKDANQELVIDLENKTTYFEEYKMQEDGTRYAIYKAEKVDGVYIPDLEAIQVQQEANDKAIQISEAKEYLASTDFYMTVDKYATLSEERKLELTNARAEARVLINTLES